MFGKEDNERAVSPVVGVILMVAITVILAAVIGAFVLDLGSDQEQNPTAGVTFDYDKPNDQVTVTVVDPGNVDSLSVNSGAASGNDGNLSAEAGETVTIAVNDGSTDTVQVTGTVGTSEALIDSYETTG